MATYGIASSIAKMSRVALDLLYPPRCAVCTREGEFLCPKCEAGLPRTGGVRCDVCWLPMRLDYCFACAEHPLPLQRLRSVFRYEGDVRRLIHAYKFGGQSCLAPVLARYLVEAYQRHGFEADVIVPVPLAGMRRRTRGYNQALLLARELSRRTGVEVVEALSRRGHSTPQATSATAEERRLNVEGVFNVSKPEAVHGRHVLLIDDVATTGATLGACAGELNAAGALSVSALTLARED